MRAIDTYCSLPFVGFDHRVKHVCCWTASQDRTSRFEDFSQCVNADVVKKLQQDLLAGVKNPLCKTCWDHESLGLTSLRLMHLKDKSPQTIHDEVIHKQLKHLVIDSGNVCNLSCRTCSPESSSSLIKEFRAKSKVLALAPFATKIRHINPDRFKKENFDSIETIHVLGGEPFQNLNHLTLLKHVISIGRSSQCRLSYSTNGTVPLHEQIKQILGQFAKVDISISIDAVGEQFEYVRTNAQWTATADNISDLIAWSRSDARIALVAHPTISCLNVLYLESLFEWYRSRGLDWIIVFCESPKEYSFSIFDDHERHQLIDRLSASKFDTQPIIKQVQRSVFDGHARSRFYQQIEWTKTYKNLDASRMLPDLLALLNSARYNSQAHAPD